MNILVIGKGFVGDAVGYNLSKMHTVHYLDPIKEEFFNFDQLDELDGVVLCLPTPSGEDGRCDDSLVTQYYESFRSLKQDLHILIKSTTSIPTLKSLDSLHDKYLTFSPEFLVASNARYDLANAKFFVYAGEGILGYNFWKNTFTGCVYNSSNTYRLSSMIDAGFMKYAINSFLATKVSFMNELHDLYEKVIGDDDGDNNFNYLMLMLTLDSRIGSSHMKVPGPDGFYGWGGACFPKDTSEFYGLSVESGSPMDVLGSAIKVNATHRSKNV